MPWTVRVVDYNGKPVGDDVVCDFDVGPVADEMFPLLGSIDEYDDTRFNRLQLQRFLKEWEQVRERAASLGKGDQWQQIKHLVSTVDEEPLRYLVFIGD